MSPKKKIHKADGTAEFEKLLKQADGNERYVLRLYITGTTHRSATAIANLRSLCEDHLSGRYDLEVIDIYQQPGAASREQIIAAPTLVKQFPRPPKRLVGDLSDRDKILIGLDIVVKGVGSPAKSESKTKWVKL